MRRYETIFILRPNVGEEEISRIVNNSTQIIVDDKGTMIDSNRWGMKKLAYLIKKESLGYYVFFDYAGTPAAVNEMERKFRIDDNVLKYLTVKLSDDISEEEIQQAIADASNKAAAVAEEDGEEEEEEAEEE